jgi:hypothetical protein
MDSNETLATKAPGVRLQFGLRAFLFAVLIAGPLLAWATMRLGFFTTPMQDVRGRVFVDGSRAKGFALSLLSKDRSFIATTTTNAKGEFVFQVPVGEYYLTSGSSGPEPIDYDDPAPSPTLSVLIPRMPQGDVEIGIYSSPKPPEVEADGTVAVTPDYVIIPAGLESPCPTQ